jgi:hypothetical protein
MLFSYLKLFITYIQILIRTLNFSDITSKFRNVAMFVINLHTPFHV